MVPKKYLFMTGSCERDTWMWKIYQELAKHEDINPHFIASREKNVDKLVSLGASKEDITTILSLQGKYKPNLKYLQECEKKYGINIWDLWQVNAVRKKSRAKLPKKEILGYFQYAFKKIEKIIKDFKPDYYVIYGTAGFQAMIFSEVLRKNGVKIIELAPSVIQNRFTVLNDLSNISYLLKKKYNDIIKGNISKEEKKKAEEFIHDFRNKPKQPDCAKKFIEPLSKRFKRYASYGYQLIKYKKSLPNINFIFWPFIQKIYDNIEIFEKPKKNEKYVLFPLHFQPEATTLIYGKWYTDQATLIENISKSIPLSHMLYVKEHPYGYGNRTIRFYKRIKKLPNVRLIGPHEKNFELIKNCSLLITITGTSGWEALLFKKQVLTFGNIFYNVFEETKKVDNINELPNIIRKRLNKNINQDKLTKFIAAILRSSYKGLARLPSDCANASLDEDNIKQLVKGIRSYINNNI